MLNFPVKFAINSLFLARRDIDENEKKRLALLGALYPGGIMQSAVFTEVFARNATPTTPVATTSPVVTPPGTVQVAVPDVTHTPTSFDNARKRLEGFGLQVQRQPVLSTTVGKDVVISQNPEANTTVAVGTTVTLSVNPGIPVPNVINLRIEDAQSQLGLFGLTGHAIPRPSDEVDTDLVISQNPAPDTLVSPISPDNIVRLVVSSGSPLVDLPNVVIKADGSNYTYEEAREILQDLDFKIYRNDVSGAQASGTVVKQEPGPGKVSPEILVTLSVSKGDVTG